MQNYKKLPKMYFNEHDLIRVNCELKFLCKDQLGLKAVD